MKILTVSLIAFTLLNGYLRAEPAALPDKFAIVFTFGYGEDDLFPGDRATYEDLLRKVKTAGFNTILGSYEPWKHELCKMHGLAYVVNLLTTDYHVYKNPDGAAKLCEKLRNDKSIRYVTISCWIWA